MNNLEIIDSKEKYYHKAYERINFYKDLFVHEISNLLSNVNSAVDLCSLYRNNPQKLNEIEELYDLIKEQVNKGSDLLSNFQKLSEIEINEIPIMPIGIYKILKKTIKFVITSFPHRKINVNFDPISNELNVSAN